MKTSDIQMSPTELATLQGLGGDLGQVPAFRAPLVNASALFATGVRLPTEGLKGEGLKQASADAVAVRNQLVAARQAQVAAEQQQQQQQQQTTDMAAPASFMDTLKKYATNPYVIGGVVLVVGAVGFLIWKRSQSGVAQVSAVETLALEGVKTKRKKRRSKRKSKK